MQEIIISPLTYGSSDRYAREKDGRVVVLPAALTRDLDIGRMRLMERRLIRAARPEIEALETPQIWSIEEEGGEGVAGSLGFDPVGR